jgi:RNA polymerase sigma factor (sigma-70 family)
LATVSGKPARLQPDADAPALDGAAFSGKSGGRDSLARTFAGRVGMRRAPLHSEATPYELSRPYVMRVLTRRCSWLCEPDREALFHDSYATLLDKQARGSLQVERMAAGELRAWLTRTALNHALNAGRDPDNRRSAPLDAVARVVPDDGPSPDELVSREAERAWVREIVAELPERARKIVKLRFYFERSPEEIQRILAVSPRAYRKEIEAAFAHIARRLELVRDGRWCEARRSLLLAYAAGLAGPRRVRLAEAHLAECSSCALMVTELRHAAERVAALLPVPAFAGDEGRLGRFGEIAEAAREEIGDFASGAKQQLYGLVSRTPAGDPTTPALASGARPGSMVAAIASCLAVGGGAATYCATQGIPEPVRNVVGLEHVVVMAETGVATCRHKLREIGQPKIKLEHARVVLRCE